jgi:nucleoporin NDC1
MVNVATAIPELLRSDAFPWEGECCTSQKQRGGKSSRLPTTVEDAVRTMFENWVPQQGKALAVSPQKWWTQERLSRCVEACLPNPELDVVVIDGRMPNPFPFLCSYLCFPSQSFST